MYLLMVDEESDTLETLDEEPTSEYIRNYVSELIYNGHIDPDLDEVDVHVFKSVKFYSAKRDFIVEEVADDTVSGG